MLTVHEMRTAKGEIRDAIITLRAAEILLAREGTGIGLPLSEARAQLDAAIYAAELCVSELDSVVELVAGA